MPVPIVVPDASVILKWVLPSDDEPDADKALLLRDSILNEKVRAVVPALWLYEVGNTIARRFPAHAMAWLESLVKFELGESPPTLQWLAAAIELTGDYKVTFYDAAYHATAIVHDGLFVTADASYVSKAKDAGAIIMLRDWSSTQ